MALKFQHIIHNQPGSSSELHLYIQIPANL